MKIRKVRKEDEKKVEKFRNSEWEIFHSERNSSWNKKTISFVALDGKTIIGFLKIKVGAGVAKLKELIVKKEYRRKKIGARLIEKFEEIAKKEKCHVIYLQTSEKHKEALRFYKKRDYKKITTLKKYEGGFDWYLFEKRLK